MKLKTTLTSIYLLTLSSTATAGLINGGFESADLNGWSTSGSVLTTTSIADFQTGNYGRIGPINTFERNHMAQLSAGTTSVGDLVNIMGTTEAALEATNANKNAIDGSLMYQSVIANAGDIFRFSWNFVEEDYLPHDDWAFYGIQFEGEATQLFKLTSLGEVGPDRDATINGWEEMATTISQTGNYTFYFGVVNVDDISHDSTLFIDSVSAEVSEPSSFAIFAASLLGLLRLRRKA